MVAKLLEPPNCACFSIRRAARKITQAYDQALKPAGIQATQFTLLAILQRSDDRDGIVMSALAARLGMDRTTLTRNLALAERLGWVSVKPGEDRRERLVVLTAAGGNKLKAALPYWKIAQERVLEQLGPSGLTELLALSRRIEPT